MILKFHYAAGNILLPFQFYLLYSVSCILYFRKGFPMTKPFLILVLFLSFIVFTSTDCKHSPTGLGDITQVDTTSHAFTFQQYSWGGGGGSFLKDVAILSDTNIWVVGGINIVEYDSTGKQIYTPYGAVHWDGTNWKLVKLPTNIGLTYTQYLTPTGIIAFSLNDIWVANAGGIHKYDGIKITRSYWIANYLGNAGVLSSGQIVQKVWGTSDNNLYAVATGGGIAHFDGSNWQKLSSPTSLDIMNIYGATNPRNGKLEILAVATQLDSLPAQSQLLKIDGTSVTVVSTFSTTYFSTWFVPGEKYYIVGDGIITTPSMQNPSWSSVTIDSTTQYEAGHVCGTNANDIFITGSNLDIIHFNGSTWYNYAHQIPSSYLGGYPGVALRGNTMVAVGFDNQTAILLMGKR